MKNTSVSFTDEEHSILIDVLRDAVEDAEDDLHESNVCDEDCADMSHETERYVKILKRIIEKLQ